MKHLKCNDVSPEGSPECPFMAVGETDKEVIDRMKQHAGAIHADLMKDATPESMAEWDKMAPTKITEA
ncbi:DUF1059 domain-containing protein [Patescibacteria group bacterium]